MKSKEQQILEVLTDFFHCISFDETNNMFYLVLIWMATILRYADLQLQMRFGYLSHI